MGDAAATSHGQQRRIGNLAKKTAVLLWAVVNSRWQEPIGGCHDGDRDDARNGVARQGCRGRARGADGSYGGSSRTCRAPCCRAPRGARQRRPSLPRRRGLTPRALENRQGETLSVHGGGNPRTRQQG